MHVNKPLPASINSPSNSQFKDFVEGLIGRCEFYFLLFSYFIFRCFSFF